MTNKITLENVFLKINQVTFWPLRSVTTHGMETIQPFSQERIFSWCDTKGGEQFKQLTAPHSWPGLYNVKVWETNRHGRMFNSVERHWQVNLPTWPITEWGMCDVRLSVKVSYSHSKTTFYKQASDHGLTQILRVCLQCGVWCCSILNSEMFWHKSRLEVTNNKDWYIKYRGQDCIWWTGNWITASS